MCGIAGFSGAFDRALLQSMIDVIRHRGPDGHGTWCDEQLSVGLAHRRLSIIDLSAQGAQPMWDVRRRACITYNGELYNYRELRDELVGEGVAFRSHTDTEVLLNLYLRDGTDMLRRLSGIFAFAIWDAGPQQLFLARDAIGVKPLYVAELPSGVIFASELKALLQERTLSRELDGDAVADTLTFLWSPSPRTLLRSVRKVLPGEALTVRAGRVTRRWKWFALTFDVARLAERDAVARSAEVIRAAVARQMVSDVPVGAFLSGGLDSSTVVACARSVTGELPCFTIAFSRGTTRSEGIPDDLPFARQVARHLGVELHEITVGPQLLDGLPRMVYHLDEPQADLAPLNVFLIAEAARRSGIPVLLSGAGGDDIFGGYRRHVSLWLERWWSWLPRPARVLASRLARVLPQDTPSLRRISKVFRYADRDADGRIAAYFYWLDPSTGRSLLSGAFANRDGSRRDPLWESLARLPPDMPRLNRMLFLDATYFLVDHNLNYTDKMGMAHGVEIRVPLLDLEVVHHAGSLPPRFKQHGRWGKWVLREAMRGVLPDQVLYRGKTGFGVPLRNWFREGLGDMMEDLLSPATLERRGIFSAAGVRNLLALHRAGRLDAAYPLLSIACIELWCRAFLDRAPVVV